MIKPCKFLNDYQGFAYNKKERNQSMTSETTYFPDELEHGICRCCNEESDEILKEDGRCIDCIEEEKFINQTMSPDTYSLDELKDW